MINRHKMCCVAWKNNIKIEKEAEERGRCVECEIMYAKSNNVVISSHQSCWAPSKVPGAGGGCSAQFLNWKVARQTCRRKNVLQNPLQNNRSPRNRHDLREERWRGERSKWARSTYVKRQFREVIDLELIDERRGTDGIVPVEDDDCKFCERETRQLLATVCVSHACFI